MPVTPTSLAGCLPQLRLLSRLFVFLFIFNAQSFVKRAAKKTLSHS